MPGFAPSPSLATRVLAIDVVESDGGESLVLPSSGVVLGLQFRGRVMSPGGPLAPAGVTGVQDGARRYAYLGATGSVLVRFSAQGAACLGVPVQELSNRSVALEDLLGRARVAEVRERLLGAPDDASRVAEVEALLGALPFARDPLVTRALALLESGPGGRVAHVARALGMSERQLERRFLARVGVAPKQFAKLRRFERALRLAAEAPSLAAAAHEAGYYDQSHFVRDHRAFTGEAPHERLRRGGR